MTIRTYGEDDAVEVGRLIARTHSAFNLSFATPEQRAALLGPFRFARSADPARREAIARAIAAPLVLVAEDRGTLVGVLRGGRLDHRQRVVLQSLFVAGSHHRRGVGRRLVERFEKDCRARGTMVIKVASTLHAVPFYQALGYRRSTGVRTMSSFEGAGLPYQPMKKRLQPEREG
jgi:GNAT superfamily N-acetyltransferase